MRSSCMLGSSIKPAMSQSLSTANSRAIASRCSTSPLDASVHQNSAPNPAGDGGDMGVGLNGGAIGAFSADQPICSLIRECAHLWMALIVFLVVMLDA